MIRRVTIENFRSIRSAQVELRPFNCLVGANNSGKSNLVDALSFVHDLVIGGIAQATAGRGGPAVKHYGAGDSDAVSFIVEMGPALSKGYRTLTYSCSLDPTSSRVVREELSALDLAGATVEIASGRLLLPQQPTYTYIMKQEGPKPDLRLQDHVSASRSILAKFGDQQVVREAFAEISGWEFFNYTADSLKRPGQVFATDSLARDGSNFASYVHTVHSSHRKFFNQIETELRKSFPDVEELLSPLSGSQTTVGMKERWFNRFMSSSQMSDGMMEFLAHLVVMYGPSSPSLVAFEEPESHIHARLMEKLVTIMKEASKQVQILITTHSANLLDRLEVEDIVLVERQDGRTVAKRATDAHELVESIKGWALGDAMSSGLLERGA